VKFSCERCGKKYATAETPAAGRIYRIDCKACGHLIVVKASPGAPASPATEMHPPAVAGSAAAETAAAPDGVHAADGPDLAAASHAELDAPPRPSGDALYVDLFADVSRPDLEQAEPFLAERTPLPEGHGQGSSDRDGHATLPKRLPPPATAPLPSRVRPPRHGTALPMALLGAGALVVVGIVAFVLLGGKAPVSPPRAAVEVHPSAAVPDVQRPVASAFAPRALPAAAPDRPKPAREPKLAPAAEDARRAEERRPRDRGGKERERLAREQQAREDRDLRQAEVRERQRRDAERIAADPQEDPGGLSQATVERVLTSTRNAFERCILAAAKSSEVALDGRRVMLRLNIQNTGAVTYPTLDDVTLAGTELGACLKNAARLMVFPKFMGDPMHVEVPLALVAR
jgi:DNA-directed RNA polymerase subunit RPC12/RpoP